MFYIPGNKGWGDYLGQGIAQGVNLGLQYGIPLMLQKAESKRIEEDLARLEQWQRTQQAIPPETTAPTMFGNISPAGTFRMPMPHMTSRMMQNQVAQNRLQQMFPPAITPYQKETLINQQTQAEAAMMRARAAANPSTYDPVQIMKGPNPFGPPGTVIQQGPTGKMEIVYRPDEITPSQELNKMTVEALNALDPVTRSKIILDRYSGEGKQVININTENAQATAEQKMKIFDEFRKVADRRNAAQPDSPYKIEVETTPSGQIGFKEVAKKPVSEGLRTAVEQKQNLLRMGEEIASLYKPSYTGWLEGGWIKRIKEKTGWGLSAQQAAFLSSVEKTLKQTYADSGKQLSDREMDRLMAFMPTSTNKADLKWQSDFVNFLKEVHHSLLTAKDIHEKGGGTPLPDFDLGKSSQDFINQFYEQTGWQKPQGIGTPANIPSAVPEPVDESLGNILNSLKPEQESIVLNAIDKAGDQWNTMTYEQREKLVRDSMKGATRAHSIVPPKSKTVLPKRRYATYGTEAELLDIMKMLPAPSISEIDKLAPNQRSKVWKRVGNFGYENWEVLTNQQKINTIRRMIKEAK